MFRYFSTFIFASLSYFVFLFRSFLSDIFHAVNSVNNRDVMLEKNHMPKTIWSLIMRLRIRNIKTVPHFSMFVCFFSLFLSVIMTAIRKSVYKNKTWHTFYFYIISIFSNHMWHSGILTSFFSLCLMGHKYLLSLERKAILYYSMAKLFLNSLRIQRGANRP